MSQNPDDKSNGNGNCWRQCQGNDRVDVNANVNANENVHVNANANVNDKGDVGKNVDFKQMTMSMHESISIVMWMPM